MEMARVSLVLEDLTERDPIHIADGFTPESLYGYSPRDGDTWTDNATFFREYRDGEWVKA